jgi:hypothetical protein
VNGLDKILQVAAHESVVNVCGGQVEDSERPEACRHRVQACIFKVGDDCRQDVLALQVVNTLHPLFIPTAACVEDSILNLTVTCL